MCQEGFGVTQLAIGEYEPNQIPDGVAHSIVPMNIDSLSLWRDQEFTAPLVASNVSVIFLCGAWLEEEIFIAALEGVRLGYDVRVLADLSVAHVETDRSLVLDRLALHGVLATTVRQTLLEWAVCLDDPILKQKVRQLLS
jgi:nicotinamidase-related amidase